MILKQCPACGLPIEDNSRDDFDTCNCEIRKRRSESAQLGAQTRRENGTQTHFPSTRLAVGFYMMDWSEHWEEDRYQ